MPSTSVQIWISAAPRHAPTIAAEKSEPPRPSVVVTPSRVAPTNPPITGMRPDGQQRIRVRHQRRRGFRETAAPRPCARRR